MNTTNQQIELLQAQGLAIIQSHYPVEFKKKQLDAIQKQIQELEHKQIKYQT